MIEIKALQIGYKFPILSISELNLQSETVYALIGANGKGKTTFLKTLNGLIKPISGSITVQNRELGSMNNADLSKTISFVGSRFEGIEHLSVFNYVALGRIPYLGLFGRISPNDEEEVMKALALIGMENFAQRITSELSDGERQMISIARALAQNTPIITLDEPTAFLDYANRKKLLLLLKSIAKTANKCVVISSHDIELCLSEDIAILQISKENKLTEISNNSLQEIISNCFEE